MKTRLGAAAESVGARPSSGAATGSGVRASVARAPGQGFAYGYDAPGNRTREQRDTLSPSLVSTVTRSAYNTVNQLTSRSGSGPLPVRFRGTVDEAASVRLNPNGQGWQDATMTPDPNSASNGKIFTRTLGLPTGANSVTVEATDFNSPTANVTNATYSLTVAGGVARTLGYDANGNLTNMVTATTTNRYEWDAEDRLIRITQLSTNNPRMLA